MSNPRNKHYQFMLYITRILQVFSFVNVGWFVGCNPPLGLVISYYLYSCESLFMLWLSRYKLLKVILTR